MFRRLARWVLRDELENRIMKPSEVMVNLKTIFRKNGETPGMSYAVAIRLMSLYQEDYRRCLEMCEEIRKDLQGVNDV